MKTEFIDYIQTLLSNPDTSVKFAAFSELISKKSTESTEFLNSIIHNNDRITKIWLSRYIAKHMRSKHGLEILSLFMADTNEHLRNEATESFSSIECSGKKEILIKMLESTNDFIIDYAIDEVGKRRIFGAVEYLERIYETSSYKRKINILKVFQLIRKKSCVRTIIKSLQTDDENLLFETIHSLGIFYKYIKWHKTIKFLDHQSPVIRKIAIWFLNHYKSNLIRDKLIKHYFNEQDPSVRNEIIEGLSRYKDFKIMNILLNTAAFSEDYNARILADSAIDRFSEDMIYKLIKKYKYHKNDKIRTIVTLKAGNLRDSKVLKWLSDTLENDISVHVRACAAESIGSMNIKKAIPYLEHAFLMDKSPVVSYTALLSLTRIWDINDLNKIFTILEFPEETHSQAQIVALRFLQKRLLRENWDIPLELRDRILFRVYSQNMEIRYLSIDILRILKEKRALIPLIELYIRTKNKDEKNIAIKAINDIIYDDPIYFLGFIINIRKKKNLFCKLLKILEIIEFNPEYDYEMILQITGLFLREKSEEIKKKIVATLLAVFQKKYQNVPELADQSNSHWIRIILECAKYSDQQNLMVFGPEIFLKNIFNEDPYVQKISISILSLLKEDRAIIPITKIALRHRDPQIKELAKSALQKILNKDTAA